MASITHWGRLEPRCRTDEFDAGCVPRSATRCGCWPASGSSASSPPTTAARPSLRRSTTRCTASGRFARPASRRVPSVLDPGTDSLEALAEGEPACRSTCARVCRRACSSPACSAAPMSGLRLLPAFLAAVPVAPGSASAVGVADDPSQRFRLAAMPGASTAGSLLDAAWPGTNCGDCCRRAAIAAADQPGIDAARCGLRDWYTLTYGPVEPVTAWNPHRLDYEFVVGHLGRGRRRRHPGGAGVRRWAAGLVRRRRRCGAVGTRRGPIGRGSCRRRCASTGCRRRAGGSSRTARPTSAPSRPHRPTWPPCSWRSSPSSTPTTGS